MVNKKEKETVEAIDENLAKNPVDLIWEEEADRILKTVEKLGKRDRNREAMKAMLKSNVGKRLTATVEEINAARARAMAKVFVSGN